MLPYLKLQQEEGPSDGHVEVIERKPDDDMDMLDAVAEDLLMAIEKKDKKLLKDALAALCDHLMDMDQEQDQNLMKG